MLLIKIIESLLLLTSISSYEWKKQEISRFALLSLTIDIGDKVQNKNKQIQYKKTNEDIFLFGFFFKIIILTIVLYFN